MTPVPFAVSTLGFPGLPLAAVAELLTRHEVRYVQLRCAEDEPVHAGIGTAARRAARRLLTDAGIGVAGLATYVRLTDGAPGLREHLQLALDLGAPALRLMPGGEGDVERWTGPAAEALAGAVETAAGSGVRLLVETHDAFLRGGDLAALLHAAGATVPAAGAIWDAMHPWRAGETVARTAAALAPWLAEVQIKDAASPQQRRPLVPGQGAVPLRDILRAATGIGFAGPVVLEHEARWYADAAPIDEAIAASKRLLSNPV